MMSHIRRNDITCWRRMLKGVLKGSKQLIAYMHVSLILFRLNIGFLDPSGFPRRERELGLTINGGMC